eukprot:Rhum_TRINITY_DN14328_c3_g2::Rhum_TRINITY_DN14328_c3_g2_i1::g.83159::m.83159
MLHEPVDAALGHAQLCVLHDVQNPGDTLGKHHQREDGECDEVAACVPCAVEEDEARDVVQRDDHARRRHLDEVLVLAGKVQVLVVRVELYVQTSCAGVDPRHLLVGMRRGRGGRVPTADGDAVPQSGQDLQDRRPVVAEGQDHAVSLIRLVPVRLAEEPVGAVDAAVLVQVPVLVGGENVLLLEGVADVLGTHVHVAAVRGGVREHAVLVDRAHELGVAQMPELFLPRSGTLTRHTRVRPLRVVQHALYRRRTHRVRRHTRLEDLQRPDRVVHTVDRVVAAAGSPVLLEPDRVDHRPQLPLPELLHFADVLVQLPVAQVVAALEVVLLEVPDDRGVHPEVAPLRHTVDGEEQEEGEEDKVQHKTELVLPEASLVIDEAGLEAQRDVLRHVVDVLAEVDLGLVRVQHGHHLLQLLRVRARERVAEEVFELGSVELAVAVAVIVLEDHAQPLDLCAGQTCAVRPLGRHGAARGARTGGGGAAMVVTLPPPRTGVSTTLPSPMKYRYC